MSYRLMVTAVRPTADAEVDILAQADHGDRDEQDHPEGVLYAADAETLAAALDWLSSKTSTSAVKAGRQRAKVLPEQVPATGRGARTNGRRRA